MGDASPSGTSTPPTVAIRASRRFGTLSPLRYPGGKAALSGVFADLIADLELTDACYVEPYAGGAGAGVGLLRTGVVNHLVVNDVDPAVHAFWTSAVHDTERFLRLLRDVPLTVEEWRRQRSIYRSTAVTDPLTLGFAFFYLNRTNRSGVLNAGVIGGQNQSGNYKIDARFNRDELIRRIGAIGELRDKITVLDLDGRDVVARYASRPDTFLYIDPPYVDKGGSLYLNAFDARDHGELANTITSHPDANWLVTYDVSSLIRELYQNERMCTYELYYSAYRASRASELLIASRSVWRSLERLTVRAAEVA